MKTSVVICEFNPLHSGHKRILDFARTFSDKVVCVMSGNFVQRGMPACAEKHKRALHALKAGADLVIELPIFFALSSAEDFALGGVKTANALNADYLVFGSECGNIDELKKCAEMTEREETNAEIRAKMNIGENYPSAVAKAIGSDLLEKPNNVLAVEYMRALKKTSSEILPVTIAREDNINGACGIYASSTALRRDESLLEKYSFDYVIRDICCEIEQKYKEFLPAFVATLSAEEIEKIYGVSEGLQNRIFAADKTHGFETLINDIKTKRYTRARLQRILLCCVLEITKEKAESAKNEPPLLNVLGVSRSSLQMLNGIERFCCETTEKADRFFAALSGETPSKKLTVW